MQGKEMALNMCACVHVCNHCAIGNSSWMTFSAWTEKQMSKSVLILSGVGQKGRAARAPEEIPSKVEAAALVVFECFVEAVRCEQ